MKTLRNVLIVVVGLFIAYLGWDYYQNKNSKDSIIESLERQLEDTNDRYSRQLKLNTEIGIYYDSSLNVYRNEIELQSESVGELRRSMNYNKQKLRETQRQLNLRKSELATLIDIVSNIDTSKVDSFTVVSPVDTLSDSTYITHYEDSSLTLDMYAPSIVDSIVKEIKVNGIQLFYAKRKAKDLGIAKRGKVHVLSAVFPEGFSQTKITTIKNARTHRWWEFWK